MRKVEEEKFDPNTLDDTLPDIIRTSMFNHDKNKEFSVLIKMPCIEYSILSKNFTFLKTLTVSDLRDYLDCGFQSWDELLLKQCMQYRKFNELLKQRISGYGGPSKPPPGKLSTFKPVQADQSVAFTQKDTANVHDVYVIKEVMKATGGFRSSQVVFHHFRGLEEFQNHILSGDTTSNITL